jgi:hypothetical protein
MALLTDGNPNDTEALRVYETAILDVASVERIDLDAKLGLATEEISHEVLGVLVDHDGSQSRRSVGVSDVVVTPQMRRWHALHTLTLVYRDAFNNQLNDRYKAKWNEYQTLSRNAKEDAMRFGIGLAANPIPKGGAPVFGFVAGLNPATIYYGQVSWVAVNGQEGAPGDLTAFETPEGSVLTVASGAAPEVAAGFNVYLGIAADTVSLQNTTPMGRGEIFTLPSPILAAGSAPGSGQEADVYIVSGRTLRRG